MTPGNTIISCSERVPESRTNQITSLAANQLIPATSTSHETRVRHFPDPVPTLNEPATADELMAAAGSGSPSSSQASKNYSCTEQSHLAASFTSAGFRNITDPLHLSPEQPISNKSRAKHFPDPALTLNVPAIADELLAAAGLGSPSAPLASTSRSSADQLNLAPSVASTGSLDVEDEDLAPQGSRTFAIQWNVSGLRTHRSELQLLLAKYQPALVCLHETNAQELKVPTDYIGKDYHLILGPGDPDVTTCRRKWIYDRANWRLFEELTSQSIRPGQALTVKEFTSRIITAAEASIPRTSGKPGRKAVSSCSTYLSPVKLLYWNFITPFGLKENFLHNGKKD
ncbi:uncharacterized protein LOC119766604 [Culex quinquefasciatus]|uniref:uncharacterized protein LOC119766604 n=1 Tax=Culex quinquefasciatus TaxID=7176 RepID=UPI0018E3882B|nr:uncharacterized protein LOC119766604 [Culex quinquefasciatus]